MREGFSSSVKSELARLPISKKCCQKNELGIMVNLCGVLNQDHTKLTLSVNNPAAYRRGLLLIKNIFPSLDIRLKRERTPQGRPIFILVVKGAEVRHLNELKGRTEKITYASKCCQRAFLRTIFLTNGSISEPRKQNHLEMTVGWELAPVVLEVMESLGIVARQFSRKGRSVIYIKDGEKVGEFLRLVGAHTSVLRFENIRVGKDIRNEINRRINCETANVDKTVKAAMEQLEYIKTIDDYYGLVKLPPKLREVAYNRINNPYASFQELAETMNPPLSKSTVSYRMNQLKKIAQGLSQSKAGI